MPWIWIGAVFMALGGVLSLSDRRLRVGVARRRVPAGGGRRTGGMIMGRLLFIVPIALFLAVVVYFFVAMRGDYDPSTLPSAMVGKPVPAFDLPGPAAPPDYAGPPVKLGFPTATCSAMSCW